MSLGRVQVAVLRLHAASTGHVTRAAYSCARGVYVRHGTKHVRVATKRRPSENSVTAKFAELTLGLQIDAQPQPLFTGMRGR
jgi:hypothetical protein